MIDPGYLDDRHDLETLITGVQKALALRTQPAFRLWRGRDAVPGLEQAGPSGLARLVRQGVSTFSHAVGTCRMGAGNGAVVDPQLKVHGLRGLRVADASVMPSITTTNTNAATIMIDEKAADLIRGLDKPPSPRPSRPSRDMSGRTEIMPPQPSARPTLGEYVIGVAGLALMRLAFTDDAAGRAARTAEIRDLLNRLGRDTSLQAAVGTEYDLGTGYQQWSAIYDQPLRLFPIEEPPMKALIETLPPGTALDAACGTGRYSTMLASHGHDVIGVDQSAAMLDIARTKLPSADFREGDLTALPLPGRSVDAVVCALALVHVPQVASALNEFARVLRPGGRLIISDVHPFLIMFGWQAQFPAQGGEGGQAPQRGFMRLHGHLPSEYTGAATAAGLRLRSLVEPPLTESAVVTPATAIVPDASRAAFTGLPAVSVWDFEHAGLPRQRARGASGRPGYDRVPERRPASYSDGS